MPVPEDARVLQVPTDLRSEEEMDRILANDGEGGYKVKGLVGLRFSAPYLHMGAVAVGPDLTAAVGLPGTLLQGELPDPANSLLALIDRGLRERVVAANGADPMLSRFNALGLGHEQWVDRSAGFSAKEQRALIHYLLYLDQDEDPPEPTAGEFAHTDGAARAGF